MTGALDRVATALFNAASVEQFVAIECERAHFSTSVTRMQAGAPAQRLVREFNDGYIDVVLHLDLDKGRGSTHMRIHREQLFDDAGSWEQLIERAEASARVSLEPAWTLPLPAAPARVVIADEVLVRDPMSVSMNLQQRVEQLFVDERSAERGDQAGSRAGGAAPLLTLLDLSVEIENERVQIRTSDDFSHEFRQTLVTVGFSVSVPAVPLPVVERVRLQARRFTELQLEKAVARVTADIHARVQAKPTPGGRYDLVLIEGARTPERVSLPMTYASPDLAGARSASQARFGWFSPFVAQADAHAVRRGLTRYRPGQLIYPTDRKFGDPLTIISDATIPYGLYSRPMGPMGAPTRRFSLIERDIAAGLSLDLREAAIRGEPANGGVGNLWIAPGRSSSEQLMRAQQRPVLQVRSLDWLDVDTHGGAFAASIRSGRVITPGGGVSEVTGGLIRGDLFELWRDARLSSETDVSGWYHGPRAIRFSNVDVT